jgi:hypothetical protein
MGDLVFGPQVLVDQWGRWLAHLRSLAAGAAPGGDPVCVEQLLAHTRALRLAYVDHGSLEGWEAASELLFSGWVAATASQFRKHKAARVLRTA